MSLTVVTDTTINVGKTTATLAGHCTALTSGIPIAYVIFQYALTSANANNMGSSWWTYYIVAGSGNYYYHDIAGLTQGTAYYDRIDGVDVATSSWVFGSIVTFTTTSGTIHEPGYIWVEGHNFHFIDADGDERLMSGLLVT